MTAFRFFLGTHEVTWLERTAVPLFVSRRRLAQRRTLPRALGPWALDSGGFTELSLYGKWTLGPREYVTQVRRFRDDVGNLTWAAPQDWMCEPEVLRKTGLGVREHQKLTVRNFVELRMLAPDLPFIPVLQGFWARADSGGSRGATYEECAEEYALAGVDLTRFPLVGLGSVCRRQATGLAFFLHVERQLRCLLDAGVRLHGFGLKSSGLRNGALSRNLFASADSLAWSFQARRQRDGRQRGCTHRSCANCLPFALEWRA